METTHELRFESPSFARRIKGMLGVDFYRLFHTPMFYIFLAIAAMIPALLVSGMGADANETATVYTNVWQVIAANKPLYVVSNMGEYANMNMVFIFGGIMVSIFIGHDYKSGYVKQLFTTHAKKQDYMISKALTGAFSMACMCITYLIGGVAAGTMGGLSYEVDTVSLVFALLSKIIMSLDLTENYPCSVVISSHILGELEKIATHYGIVRDGKMIKEMTAKEMDAGCRPYSDGIVTNSCGILLAGPGTHL